MTEHVSFFSFTYEKLQDFVIQKGGKVFNAKQIFDWVYKKREFNPLNWSNISHSLKQIFADEVSFQLPTIVWSAVSKDGTQKFLLGLKDGKTIEAVAIAAPNRFTICVSSQVGCAVGCTFCHTGTQGLTRHLSVEEIVGQYLLVDQVLQLNGNRLTNIVYMGQGEPLHNFENVKSATQIFLDHNGLFLGQRRITLSTSGLVPQILKLDDFPPVNIAISLHSPDNKVRSELMPINKAYDIERLFAAIKTIPLKAHRYITFEYLLIDQVNDRDEDIEGLCRLLPFKTSKINLIPFNDFPGSKYKKPKAHRVVEFRDALLLAGYVCTIRQTKGDDILAACGQLKSAYENDLNLWKD